MSLRAGICFVVVAAALAGALPAAAEDLGQCRIQDMRGRWYEGQVEEVEGAYRIRLGSGITVTLPKSQVRTVNKMQPEKSVSESLAPAPRSTGLEYRRAVTGDEIDSLLEGVDIPADDIVEASDMGDELPVDEASVREMLRLAGGTREENVLVKPHFVLVYTSDKTAAIQLASRLEAVYRWNVKFMRMLDVPLARPENKLEIFYFGTHKEFEAYSVNIGSGPSGALGFYTPMHNRSAFFELATFPPIANMLEMAKEKSLPHEQRQRLRNQVNQWVEFNNMTVIQHEAGHHIHFNIGLFPRDVFIDEDSYDTLPRWLVEGTTMMFEFPPTSAGASLGTTNHARLAEFDEIYGRKNEGRRLSPQLLKSFILDNSVFLRGGGATYSLGWALVYYCWKENRAGYAKYMKIIATRDPGIQVNYTQREKEFEDIFGRVDDEWIKKWYTFLDGLHLKRSVLPPDIRP